MTYVRSVSIDSYFFELEKMYILCAIWYFVGSHCLQEILDGRSRKDCHHCKSSSTQLSQTIENSTWSYRVLQKIHQGICKDHNTDGEIVKERYKIPME